MSKIDRELVKELASLLEETGLSEIEYAAGDWRVRVARGGVPVSYGPLPAVAPAAAEASAPATDASHPGAVPSPMVGTAYLRREPGAPPFVQPGQAVKEGDTLLLIEAMKTYNEVRAPRSGRITRVLVVDGAPVEFGEPLLILE
jgi:acetyl-CoA carboxylase biotin carboxyl carrier protein